MSEYQYYEFQAIDRPLDEADRAALRRLSSRAQITATSFTNEYNYGDFKGDPRQLMTRWFDLHLYVANWGTRRFMMRLPKRLFDRNRFDALMMATDLAAVTEAGDNLILDICDDGEDREYVDWEDGSGWLGALAPLRADLLSGDWRLPYLLWLTGVENGNLRDEALEPLPGIAPLNGGLQAFAEFFRIDGDLVQAAAEAPKDARSQDSSSAAVRAVISKMSESQKTDVLLRLAEGDPHVAAELRGRVRSALSRRGGRKPPTLRSASELRSRAEAIREDRERAAAERRRAERLRRERQQEQARRARLAALRRRGAEVWREVEAEVERRNASGYDQAASLISDLRALADEDGQMADFSNRLNALRQRHERKQRFLERLNHLP
ncbi:MAG: hypothetical protein OXJ53_20075 [Gammaproteobacteria bacterium]|nr:hypothetical protein [Gammaproteobacteria bacterium]MDE0271027.1 hypothetical protein [Gammaproteobacteria bacterium]